MRAPNHRFAVAFVALATCLAVAAGCGGERAGERANPRAGGAVPSVDGARDGAGDASRDVPPDTSRAGPAFLAVYRDGPLSELRVVRATDGGLVVAGAADFPTGTKVTVALLARTADGGLETVASAGATVDAGHFMTSPLAPLAGAPAPGLHPIRVSAAFGPGDQEADVLRAAADGRRYRGSGVRTLEGGRVVFVTTLEVPL